MKNPDNPKEELYFHVLYGSKKLQYGDGRKVEVGIPLTKLNKSPIRLCHNGMHGSKNARHTVPYVYWYHNRYLCLVHLTGKVMHGNDKSVGETRTVIAMRRFNKASMPPMISIRATAAESMAHNKKMRDWILRK